MLEKAILASTVAVALAITSAVKSSKLDRQPQPGNALVDFSGHYRVEGNEGGKGYKGSCVIVKSGERYRSVVMIGGNVFQGSGHVRQGVLAVSWHVEGVTGVTIYTLKGNDLVGSWNVNQGTGEVRVEHLAFVGPVD